MYIYVPCASLVPIEARRGHQTPRTGVTDGFELLNLFESVETTGFQTQELYKINKRSPPLSLYFSIELGLRHDSHMNSADTF